MSPDASSTTSSATATPADAWAQVLAAAHAQVGDPAAGPGRVLSVKLGYNPNSSSVGSVVTILLWTSTFAAIALNVVTALLQRDGRAPALPPGTDTADTATTPPGGTT